MQDISEASISAEPAWRRAAMYQKDRFQSQVDLEFQQGITIHATQKVESGSCIWDASLVLGSYLANTDAFPLGFWKNKKVVEIGSGCGVSGIVAGHLGANVTLTELDQEMLLLQENVSNNPINHHKKDGDRIKDEIKHAEKAVDKNQISPDKTNSTFNDNQTLLIDQKTTKTTPSIIDSSQNETGSLKCEEFFWGEDSSHLEKPFDFVLAADCVYEIQLFECLCKAIVDLTDKNTIVLFSIEHRWSDIEAWWWKEIKKNFTVTTIPHELHGIYEHPKIDIYELRRTKPRPGRG